MTVRVTFESFNKRRFSRPWIAKVTAWPVGGRATLAWGSFLGDDSGGDCEIEAEQGDVIRYGQKDLRGNKGISAWAVVLPDGNHCVCDEREAADTFRHARVAAAN